MISPTCPAKICVEPLAMPRLARHSRLMTFGGHNIFMSNEHPLAEPGFAPPSPLAIDFDDSVFESKARSSKSRGNYWMASDIVELLGYKDVASLQPAITKAQQASLSLGIPVDENFRRKEGSKDWALTRFGCYLVAMNGNVRKPEVAAAQAYFAVMAEGFRQYVEQSENMDRILIREEIKDHETTLAATAQTAGVQQFAFFQNKGYMGLYNMGIRDLKARKGIPDGRSPLDFMRRSELAANLFRLTQTEEKIRNDQIRGQEQLENAAFKVGRKVRQTMKELSGVYPEDIEPAEDIRTVRTELKQTSKKLSQPSLEAPEKRRRSS